MHSIWHLYFLIFGTDGATAGSKTYYFDDVSFGSPLSTTNLASNNFRMYPNPTNDFLNLSCTSIIDNIQIYNTLGQLLSKQTSTSNELSVNVSNLSKGVYIVVAQVGATQIREQFIKE